MAGEGLRDQMVVVPVAMLVAMVVGVHVRKMTTDKVAHARRSLGLILAQTTLFPSLSKSPGGGGGGGGQTDRYSRADNKSTGSLLTRASLAAWVPCPFHRTYTCSIIRIIKGVKV